MIIWQYDRKSIKWVLLLVMVLASNLILYRSPITHLVIPEETKWLILGSIIDLAIISPLLVMAIDRKKKFNLKRLIILMAGGLVSARFLIPAEYFEPFKAVSYAGFAVEGSLLLLEMALFFLLVRYMPAIIKQARSSEESLLFSFPTAVEGKLHNYPIVKAVAAEFLMFYYAFMSWKKSPAKGNGFFTLHKNSSLAAMQIMLIHAVVIETIGVHWLLHEMSAILSIIMLILNVYTVIFFIGDIQAVRLNPLKMTDQSLYISLGLAKKMVLPIDNIESITIDPELLGAKLDRKTTIDFIAKDFDTVTPHMILELKRPSRATYLFGMEKTYTRVALRLDSPAEFLEALKERMS